jgi:hypothetical protein
LFCRFLYTSKQTRPNWWSQLGFRALRAHQQPPFQYSQKSPGVLVRSNESILIFNFFKWLYLIFASGPSWGIWKKKP